MGEEVAVDLQALLGSHLVAEVGWMGEEVPQKMALQIVIAGVPACLQ